MQRQRTNKMPLFPHKLFLFAVDFFFLSGIIITDFLVAKTEVTGTTV